MAGKRKKMKKDRNHKPKRSKKSDLLERLRRIERSFGGVEEISTSSSESESEIDKISRQNGNRWLLTEFDRQSQRCQNIPRSSLHRKLLISGEKKENLMELKDKNEYYIFPLNANQTINGILRLESGDTMNNLPINFLRYSIEIQQQDEEILRFNHFNRQLYELFIFIYNTIFEAFNSTPNAVVALNLTHPLNNASFPSEPMRFTKENGPYLILKMLQVDSY